MRLVFFFMSYGAAPTGSNVPWNSNIIATNGFVVKDGGLASEGYLYLIKQMVKEKVIDDAIIFIESNRGTGACSFAIEGTRQSIPCYVIPEIGYADNFLKPGDIIWARGGFRTWFEWLYSKKGKHWLLLYAANTGRERWTFWDIIFNDLDDKFFLDRKGRLWFPFKKPVNENIFMPIKIEQAHDICIGASYIHDRKAQWKTIEAVIHYKKLFSADLDCVLAGAFRGGLHSSMILNKIAKNALRVSPVGMLPRPEMNRVYNRSKLFVYLGRGGQNDRGPLEALRCGTPIVIADYRRHASFFRKNERIVRPISSDNFDQIADILHDHLQNLPTKEEVSKFFIEQSGVDTVILPEMRKLFNFLGNNAPNTEALRRFYV